MSTEAAVETVLLDQLRRNLPAGAAELVLGGIDAEALSGKRRVLVLCQDDGEDQRVKVSGVYARSIEAKVKAIVGFEHGEAAATTLLGALDAALRAVPPGAALAGISAFSYLRINEQTEGKPVFDSYHWSKETTLQITALLA